MTANTPASRKAKGRRLQQAVRQDLVDRLGIDPYDPTLVQRLYGKGVQITARSPQDSVPWFVSLLVSWLPFIGQLFRHDSFRNDKSELIILVLPQILGEDGEPLHPIPVPEGMDAREVMQFGVMPD